MKLRSLAVAGGTIAALAVAPAVAGAASTGTPQIVAGTTASTISINVATPAAFGTDFAPSGNEVSTTGGTVVALSTSPNWNLQVKDYGTSGSNGNGKMDALTAARVTALTGGIAGIDLTGITLADPALCTSSAAELGQAAKIRVLENIASAAIDSVGKTTLGASDTPVASSAAGNLLALPLTTFDTTFYQTIGTGEAITSGCQYNIAVAYTLS